VDDGALESVRKGAQRGLASSDQSASAAGVADGDAGRPVPPFNKDAKSKDGVYPFDTLISPNEMSGLKGPAKILCKAGSDNIAKWRAKSVYPKFVLGMLETLLPNKLEAKLKQVQILLHMSCLTKLYTVLKKPAKMSTITKKLGALGLPEVFITGALDKFATPSVSDRGSSSGAPGGGGGTVETRFRMSPFQRDTAISHVLVMALATVDFRPLPVAVLAADLDLTEKKIKDYLRNVGCKVTAATKDSPSTASMSLPLTFPVRLGRAM
jgi:hypothetical protein